MPRTREFKPLKRPMKYERGEWPRTKSYIKKFKAELKRQAAEKPKEPKPRKVREKAPKPVKVKIDPYTTPKAQVIITIAENASGYSHHLMKIKVAFDMNTQELIHTRATLLVALNQLAGCTWKSLMSHYPNLTASRLTSDRAIVDRAMKSPKPSAAQQKIRAIYEEMKFSVDIMSNNNVSGV